MDPPGGSDAFSYAVESLWSASQTERLAVPIRDIVLVRDQKPYLWLFSKQGQVAKKRRVSWEHISKRFVKLALRTKVPSQRRIVCVARSRDGSTRLVTLNDFLALVESPDSVDAIQSFVGGQRGGTGLFRNEYKLAKKLAVSMTYKVTPAGEMVLSRARRK